MSFLNLRWLRAFSRQPDRLNASENDELEPLEGKYHEAPDSPVGLGNSRPWVPVHKTTLITIVTANVLLFMLSTAMLWSDNTFKRTKCSEKAVSSYSPVFDRVKVKTSLTHFNYTFWPEDPPSIWQLPPSPEVDEAWHNIVESLSFPITGDEVRRLGYDPRTVWPFEKEDAGEDAYMAIVNFVHQAHCLNLFRMAAFPGYYGDMREKYKGQMFPWETHLLHCQNILMSEILCHADVGVTIFQKFKGFRGPDANFGQDKMCRNVEDILQWKWAHEIQPKGPFLEWPSTPIIESDPEFLLTPKGSHSCQTGYSETDGERHCLED
ncbi:hypothetical protein VM1G_06404 [Cytospora mali]|uniref:Cyclochlorotine biosynthesis protein O n=1 Tax=Cytospora mali TaxID=578113 RepID=A0A194W1N5_CYTMA|nr:hypothetical protein VM1G_06404 [Valsa mali]